MSTRSELVPVNGYVEAAGPRELDLFRGVVRSLARDATEVLDGLMLSGEIIAEPVEAKLAVVHHYLDYMTRLCDGMV